MRNATCKRCPLHAGARTVCIDGDGPRDADILVVGQNPGMQEDRAGKPFVGASGKVLRTQLAKTGLGTAPGPTIRYTNLVRCVTPDNREPTAKEIKACRPYLDAEIARVSPKYIVPLGAPATRAIAKAKVSIAHGQIIEKDGQFICPTYHPNAIFRDPSKLQVIQQDLARLQRQIDGTLGATQDAFKYRIVTDRTVLREFLDELDKADEVAYDTETNGLFIRKPDFVIRCIAFALPDCSWVIPLEMPGSLYEGNWQAQSAIFRVLARKLAGKWVSVFHGKYDSGAIKRTYSVSLPYDFDAMLAHHLIDENQDHDLKYVSRVELDCEEYDLSKTLKLSDSPEWLLLMQVPANRELYWKYNGRDAWNTLHLARKFAAKFRMLPRLRRLFNELVMPSSRALEAIEAEGLPVDHETYRVMEAEVTGLRDDALRTLNDSVGRTDINWGSHPQVRELLYIDLELPVHKRTKKGGLPSTAEDAIVDLKGSHPVVDQLLKYREYDKLLGTYLEGWKQFIIGNQIYFSYKQPGTVTGRYSSRLHQMPTDGEIRSIISVGEDLEWEFVAADLSQAELRIAAEMSGDVSLIAAYREGRDVHWDTVLFMIGAGHMHEYTRTALEMGALLLRSVQLPKRIRPNLFDSLEAMRIVGVDKCAEAWKGWKEARTRAKRVNFGYLYGMYEKKFIEKAKVDYDWYCTWAQAHAFRTGFFELRSGLEPWHNRCKRIARIDGYVTNMFGRVRRLPGIQSTDKLARMEAERQAVNAPVQGTIGDWKAAAMVEINETIDRDQFRLGGEHHDATLGRVRRSCIDVALPKIRRIMERPKLLKTFKIQMQVPMVTDINIGPWGKGKVYHDPT